MAAVATFLRHTPKTALQSYFEQEAFLLDPPVNWAAPESEIIKPLLRAVDQMSDLERDRLVTVIDRVAAMANELGEAAIYSVTEIKDRPWLDAMANAHERSLWMFLNAQDRFRHAEEVRYSDRHWRGRMWAGYVTEVGCVVMRDDAARHAFVAAIKEFSGAAHADVDIFRRIRTTYDGDECNLVQVTIYREGRPDDLLRFDDKGRLVRQAYRPVFEAVVTYEPATGGIEVIANDKVTRREIVKAAITHLLGITFEERHLPLRQYDLSVLLTPYDFPVDEADGIEGVEVRELRLTPIGDSGRRVTLETNPSKDGTIWAMADELFAESTSLRDAFVITRAKLTVKLAPHPDRSRRRSLTMTITWPHGCDLKDRTATEQMIGEKYLRRWGILVDDPHLIQD